MAAKVSLPGLGEAQEALWKLRQVAQCRVDWRPIVPKAVAGDDVVVLVHGFLATAGMFRPLRAHLEREAHAQVASFSHAPGLGVKRIAKQLAELVDRIPHGTRIHLVGHSLGAIVARWYVQEMAGHERVAQTISIAAPFGGSHVAARLPLFVGADLHGASDVLARLRETAHVGDVPHTSIVGTADRLVTPPECARFHHGDVIVLEGRGHNALLFDRESIGHVVARVKNAALV